MNFPEHWASFNMLDLIDYEGGSQPPKKDFIYEPKKGYVRLVQIRDYGNNPFPTYVPFTPKLKLTEEDDIMIARYGGSAGSDSLGRICEGIKGAYNVALTKVIYPKSILPRSFVKYLLDGPWLKERLNSLSRSCQSGFNRDDLDGLLFPLPPLNEQKRIVEKLDVILPRVKNAKARLEKIPAILKKFRQSVLAAACSGRLTEDWREGKDSISNDNTIFEQFSLPDVPLTWNWKSVSELVEEGKNALKAGPFGSSLKKEFYTKTGYKIYGQEQVISGDAFLGDYYIDEIKFQELISCQVKPQDVLISLVGTVGKVLILPENCLKGIINPRLVKISFDNTIYSPEFFKLYFLSPLLKSFYDDLLHGSTMDVLNLGIIKTLPFPLPPLEEQHEIVRRVEKIFALADSLEAKYKKAFTRVEKIEQSILAKAFRGELVEPDPNDEPAEELLKQIMEEKVKLLSEMKSKKMNKKPVNNNATAKRAKK